MEKLTNDYYSLVAKSSVKDTESLLRFGDFELENQETLDIDLSELLRIS